MSAQPSLFDQQKAIRSMKKHKIYRFFLDNLGCEFGTQWMHQLFGTGFRTRCSEINRAEDSEITIRNRMGVLDGRETSIYFAERRI